MLQQSFAVCEMLLSGCWIVLIKINTVRINGVSKQVYGK